MKKVVDWAIRNPFWVTAFTCVAFFLLPFKPKPFGDDDYHLGTIQVLEYILNGFSGDVLVSKGFVTLFFYLPAYAVAYPMQSMTAYYGCGVVLSWLFVCLGVKMLFDAFSILGFSDRTKLIMLLLLSLFPVHVYYSMGINGEAFAFFSSAMFVYFWCKVVRGNPTEKHFVFLALSLVLIYGIKPSMLPFVIVVAGYVFFVKFGLRRKLIFGATMLALPALMVFEASLNKDNVEFKKYVFRNQILWSRFELREEPFNWMPQHGRKGASIDYKRNIEKRAELDSICAANGYDPTEYYIDWVKDDIISNPGLTLRQYFLKFFQSQSFIITPLAKSDKPAAIKYGVHIYINLINFALLTFGLSGLVLLFREKQYRVALPFFFFWGWCLLYICIFHSEQRYMFVFRAGLIFLSAFAINRYFGKGKTKIEA